MICPTPEPRCTCLFGRITGDRFQQDDCPVHVSRPTRPAHDEFPAGTCRAPGVHLWDETYEAMCQRIDEQAAALVVAEAARERFREHSVLLNQIGWRVSEALGRVGPDDEECEGNVVEDLETLIALHLAAEAARNTAEERYEKLVAASAKMRQLFSDRAMNHIDAIVRMWTAKPNDGHVIVMLREMRRFVTTYVTPSPTFVAELTGVAGRVVPTGGEQ